MSDFRMLQTKLNALAEHLRNKLKDEYDVEIELHFSSKNNKNELTSYAKIIITKDKRDIGLAIVYIDLDASIYATLLHIKNVFDVTDAFELYRKE